jgi:hypothetical protein
MDLLDAPVWRARADAHGARADAMTAGHRSRRARGEAHPVEDFLYTYYPTRPSVLRRWHPGAGVVLADADERAGWRHYVATEGGMRVDEDTLRAERADTLDFVGRLLRATAARPAHLGCFGLHEWAMVHGADETRHPAPLRLGAIATDEVVESHRLACSHFDAFRFFTPSAAPLNLLQPGRDDRPAYEQPGCLHATMDLYKHAFRLWPLVGSDLVADCFELAWDVRIVDMRAAPYDLSGLTLDPDGVEWTPLRIETPDGKQEYAAHQRRFAARAAPLRAELVARCERLSGASPV